MANPILNLYRLVVPENVRLRIYKIRNPEHFRRLRSTVNPSSKGDFSLRPFDEQKCIFIHITKTAGTSVARSLFGHLPYHYTADEYRVIFGKHDFNQYFKFAFVRNPWDRLYSAFRYLKAGGWDEEDRAWADVNLAEFNDFESFVVDWVNAENIKRHLHFWPQSSFLCDRRNRLLVDFVGRFETLQSDFEYIASKLNISASLGRYNRNPGQSYVDVYTDEMQSVVRRVYARDIELLEYVFDEKSQVQALPARRS